MLHLLAYSRRVFALFVFSSLLTNAYAANLTISGISDAQVEEFTYYQSPVPEANNPSGNVVWSLYNENLADYSLLKTLPRFNGWNDFQIIIWLALNYQKIEDFVIDPFTGIVSLPPQIHNSGNNIYYPILVATDSVGNKAALQWTVQITKNTTSSFTLNGISSSTIVEKVRYESSKPYILGTPLLLPQGFLSYNLTGDGVGEFFYADSNTGQVSLLKALIFDDNQPSNNIYNLSLTATDDAGKQAVLNWTLTVEKLPPGSEFKISGLPSAVTVTEYSNYSSPRPILNGVNNEPITFSLDNAAEEFFYVQSDGVVALTAPIAFDPNTTNTYPITLTATENLGEVASFSWIVTITKLPPRYFSIENRSENLQETHFYNGPIPAIIGSYYPPLNFTIDGQEACANDPEIDVCEYFIDPQTGMVSIPAKLHQPDPNQQGLNIYTINLTATDKVGGVGTGILTIRITFSFDKDSDGDGVKDTYELAEGTDPLNAQSYLYTWNAGTPDALSTDADADGISNIDESFGLDPYGDNNSDGVPNYLDPYDRGDGSAALCVITLVGNYPDDDGQPTQKAICSTGYGLDPIYDRDQDGIANFRDTDSDSDGIPDVIEGGMYIPSNINGIVRDSDGDGTADFLDSDSDNDGIPDNVENHHFSKISNNRGIADVFYANTSSSLSQLFNGALAAQGFNENKLEEAILQNTYMADFDQDGVPNYLDKDSDGDGIPDQLEGTVASIDLYAVLHTRLSDIDSNSNNIADVFEAIFTLGEDSNSSGIDDRYDVAITGGSDALIPGIDDIYASAALNTYQSNSSLSTEDKVALSPNTNGKLNPDFLNLDSDGDCIADKIEAGSSGSSNQFGIDNTFATCYSNSGEFIDYSCLLDSDGDGVVDFRDLDSDNDGLMDVDEASTNTLDANRDGQCDSSANLISNKLNLLDTDGDTIPDYLDLTSDGSVFDATFVQPPLNSSDYDANGRIIATDDTDIDGIDILIDSAPTVFGMLGIDCADPANAGEAYCQGPPIDTCDTDPNAPGCNTIDPDLCNHPDSAQWPECFVPPPECQLDPNLPQCIAPPAIDCDINFSHPSCLDPARNPNNGEIKTDERGAAGWGLMTMLFIVLATRRRRFE